jgi:fructose-1-phosphate kinase PfkB-like protein
MTETQTETPNVEIVVKKSRRLRIDWVVVALGAAAATLFAVNKFNEMNEPTEDAEVTVEA